MVTLIIPAARDGPAFLNGKPAWLAQLPQGHLALQQILNDLDCSNVTRIVFVTLRSHVERYCGGSEDSIASLIRNTLAGKASKEDALVRRYLRSAAAAATTTAAAAGRSSSSSTPSSSSNNNALNDQQPSAPEVVVVALDHSPLSAPETVCLGIAEAGVEGPIFIKDSDGSFIHKIEEGDYVVGLCISDLLASSASASASTAAHSNPNSASAPRRLAPTCPLPVGSGRQTMTMQGLMSKSFIERTGVLLTNLVEKRLVSDTIAVGGYGFRSASDFVAATAKAEHIKGKIAHALTATATAASAGSPTARVFVSNVVQQMLFQNVAFSVSLTRSNLCDWKTEDSWREYLATFRNIVVALEDELFVPDPAGTNTIAAATDVASVGSYVPIEERIEHLVAVKEAAGSRATIIITSRQGYNYGEGGGGGGGASSAEAAVRRLLDEHAVPYDVLLMGVPSAKTVVYSTEGTVGW